MIFTCFGTLGGPNMDALPVDATIGNQAFSHDVTAVDPFTDRIVCRVTKISPVRVASGANGLFVCRLWAAVYPRRAYFSYPTYYAIGERVHGSLDEPILKSGSRSSKR